MRTWEFEIQRILAALLGAANGNIECTAATVVGIIAFLTFMHGAGRAVGASMATWLRVAGVLVFGGAALLLAAAAARIYLVPYAWSAVLVRWTPLIAVSIVFFAAVVPLARWMLKVEYVGAALSLAAAVAVTALAVTGTRYACLAFQAGDHDAVRLRTHTEEVNSILR